MSEVAEQLYNLQFDLYRKAFDQARTNIGGTSKSILAYSKNFEESLPERFQITTLPEIIDAICKNDIILYGDFHTLRQSQRGLFRLIRTYCERLKTNQVVMALEMFKAKDQRHIDRYMRGELEDQQFLSLIKYQETWGFSWPNFRMLLDYAKQHTIPVYGINSANGGRDSLKVRDEFTASLFQKINKKHPNKKIFCLIGEYHLADSHLPMKIRQESQHTLKFMRILNNVDRFYFSLNRANQIHTAEYLKLKNNLYCIVNTPPWVKWQTFAMWEEMKQARHDQIEAGYHEDQEESSFEEDYTEDSFDIEHQLSDFIKHISSFLKLPYDDHWLDFLNVFYSQNGNFLDELVERSEYYGNEIYAMIERSILDGAYFLSDHKLILLTKLSVNTLAVMAGQFLHGVLNGFTDSGNSDAESFYRRIIKEAVGSMCCKILNPRRKGYDITTLTKQLSKQQRQRLGGSAYTKRECYRAVVKHHLWLGHRVTEQNHEMPKRFLKSLIAQDTKQNYAISHEIGSMLGYATYTKMLQGKADLQSIQDLFQTPLHSFEDVWQQFINLYRNV